MKHVTMRDVAKAAGVSVATVSYVINNNEKESIPEETKKKVLSSIEELGYIPNLTARALTRKKSGLIGIFIMSSSLNMTPWRKSIYSEFIEVVIKQLFELGYHVLVEYLGDAEKDLDIIRERALDGVFLVDINTERIYNTAGIFKVPIILIDSFIEDTIFHKLMWDYKGVIDRSKEILSEKDLFVVVDSENSKAIIEKLYEGDKEVPKEIYVAKELKDFYTFLNENREKKGIIFNEFLAILGREYIEKDKVVVGCLSGHEFLLGDFIHKVTFSNEEKGKLAARIMLDYIDKNYYKDKFTFIPSIK